MRFQRRWQSYVLVTMLAFSSLSIGISFVKACWLYIHKPSPDVITSVESRYIPLKRYLPSVGLVGYVSDISDQKGVGLWRYYIIQYALAPVTVVRGSTQSEVIGDYHTSSFLPHPPIISSHHIWRVFNNGIVLYKQGGNLALPITLILLFILMGDFAVYLITPMDLPWQLTSSFDRLLIQLWPSVVFIYCLTTNFLEKCSRQYSLAG